MRYQRFKNKKPSHLVGQAGGLTHDPERQGLLVAQSLQVAADAGPLDLPLPQVVGEPDGHRKRARGVTEACLKRGVDIHFLSPLTPMETNLRHLRLKASRCVLSMSSPLSMLVRLEWASFSKLADAIKRLSMHFLMNSCSFSSPVFPATKASNLKLNRHLRKLTIHMPISVFFLLISVKKPNVLAVM